MHNYTAWRDAFDPHLTELLHEVTRDEGRREVAGAHLADSGFHGHVVVHGHWGRPVLVFPSEAGSACDFANNGMVDAVRWLLDAGRVKLYCVDSADAITWSDRSCHWRSAPAATTSTSAGSSTRSCRSSTTTPAVQPTSSRSAAASAPSTPPTSPSARRPVPAGHLPVRQLRPDEVARWGDRGESTYFNNPTRLRRQPGRRPPRLAALAGVPAARRRAGRVGGRPDPGAAEHPPAGGLLADKGIPHELDVWGHDMPHDWPSWQRQLAHHLPRFC